MGTLDNQRGCKMFLSFGGEQYIKSRLFILFLSSFCPVICPLFGGMGGCSDLENGVDMKKLYINCLFR